MLQRLVDELNAKGLAPTTVRATIVPLRTLLLWCRRKEYVTVIACEGVQYHSGEQARDRVATVSEAVRLLAVVPDRDRAVWATAFFAGLRFGELQAAPLEERGSGQATHPHRPGAGQLRPWLPPVHPAQEQEGARTIFIPRLLVPYLARHGNRTEGLVFSPDRAPDSPFRAEQLRSRAYTAWEAAGMERIGLHECRHTYASLMIDAGVNFKAISEFMGHASTQITLDRYGHLLDDTVDDAAACFDAYLERVAGNPS